MKRETMVIRPKKTKQRIGILPTYVQRDRTKYTRKTKHRNQADTQEICSESLSFSQRISHHHAGLAQLAERLPCKQ